MKRRAALTVLGRATVRHLSGPRAFALTRLAVDARNVLTGRGPRRPAERGAPPVSPRDELRLASAVSTRDHAAARTAAAAILATHPDHLLALEAIRAADSAAGEPTAALDRSEAIRAIDADRPTLRSDDALIALLVTSDPRWLPRIPGPVHRVEPTEPPATIVIDDDGLLDLVDPELPLDIALCSVAWRIARRVEAERPAAIVVRPRPRRIAALQVALAVHEHTQLPLRLESSAEVPALPGESELERRRSRAAEVLVGRLGAQSRGTQP